MNSLLIIVSILFILLGIAHSALGEALIFQKIKKDKVFADQFYQLISKRKIGILRATWHIVTLFGLALTAVVFHYALTNTPIPGLIKNTLIFAIFSSSLLVLTWTKAKHPAWIVLIIIGTLIFFS